MNTAKNQLWLGTGGPQGDLSPLWLFWTTSKVTLELWETPRPPPQKVPVGHLQSSKTRFDTIQSVHRGNIIPLETMQPLAFLFGLSFPLERSVGECDLHDKQNLFCLWVKGLKS